MTDDDWSSELLLFEKGGATLTPGLTAAELQRAEEMHGFRFPPDLRSLLSCALPVGPHLPNWRTPDSEALRDRLEWPFDGIAFDIEHNDFWWEPWGPRPALLSEALDVARAGVARETRLIPVFSHRYLPAEPELAGNPVFSAYQTDVIYYGADLRRYLACEFGDLEYAEAVAGITRRIPFWTQLVERGNL